MALSYGFYSFLIVIVLALFQFFTDRHPEYGFHLFLVVLFTIGTFGALSLIVPNNYAVTVRRTTNVPHKSPIR
jgi:uncharacterized membrane protein